MIYLVKKRKNSCTDPQSYDILGGRSSIGSSTHFFPYTAQKHPKVCKSGLLQRTPHPTFEVDLSGFSSSALQSGGWVNMRFIRLQAALADGGQLDIRALGCQGLEDALQLTSGALLRTHLACDTPWRSADRRSKKHRQPPFRKQHQRLSMNLYRQCIYIYTIIYPFTWPCLPSHATISLLLEGQEDECSMMIVFQPQRV